MVATKAHSPRTNMSIRQWLQRFMLVLFGLFLSWFCLEVFLRVGFDIVPPNFQAQIQHVQRYPWSDERIIPRIPWVIDKDFQLRLEPRLNNFPIHWSDAKFTFNTIAAWQTHRVGFRSDPPEWPLDVVVFGDSFAFCWTDYEACWARLLQKQYRWHIFNAGAPGTGSTAQLNLMKEIVPPYQPKLVVWTWYNNDVTDDYDLAHIRNETGDLQASPLPDPPREPEGLARYSALVSILDNLINRPAKKSPYKHYQLVAANGRNISAHTNEYPYTSDLSWANNAYGWQRNQQARIDAALFLKANNAKMLIVLIPTKEEAYSAYLQESVGKDYLDKIGATRRMVMEQCQAQQWDCIDMLPAFQAAIREGKTIYYAFDSHLDRSGNTILAETVNQYILEKQLLTPPN